MPASVAVAKVADSIWASSSAAICSSSSSARASSRSGGAFAGSGQWGVDVPVLVAAPPVVVFHGSSFKEPWFLLVPAGSEAQLPTDNVVQLYRERMHIELTSATG